MHLCKATLAAVLTMLTSGLGALDRADYRAVHEVWPDGRVAWRAWTEADGPRWLVVDPATLETAISRGPSDDVPPAGRPNTYRQLRAAARLRRQWLQNAGLRVGAPRRTGAWLTFDLCPSHHPLDRSLFSDLDVDEAPLPVFLEVSGRWMETHPDDVAWLRAERDAGRLTITWVNHTENHAYRLREPLDRNFLLLPGTDVRHEVFAVEQRLLDLGEVPSVFFRFPGLVSSPELVDEVLALGLIPLGSSAWLAKQQNVRSGAVVLTHANGNEPRGLEILERWDGVHRADLATGEWHWLGLADWVGAAPPPP